ncbi:MAG: rhomboid family intramembrane serine protease [Erysipelotrichaceae bacterium]|jgi:membrane associated rhomboid family serine protease|nr:rhomboid family intramembrane serine protease [Erysipelotrichaceae bacterium]MBR2545234.1 rhomboid family intramembrane serine protease [Erysipelotrichaceae bacterium]
MYVVTYMAIGICVLIFLYINAHQSRIGYAIKAGALVPSRVRKGEIYRLLTAGFVHIRPYHLLVNMYSLYNYRWLEEALGSPRYGLLLILAILGGNILTMRFAGKGRDKISVGISGGLYGFMGFYVALLMKVGYFSIQDAFQYMLPNIVINFMPNISVTGHAGGFLVGIIFALLV